MSRASGEVATAIRIGTHFCLLAVAVAWSWHAGRDLNWDLFNYHLYAGFSVFNDRFEQDFFAAFPAYYTPYAHAPFYALTQSGLNALAIGSVLALVQGVLIGLVYELGLRVTAGQTPARRQALAVLAACLALLNPVYLLELGTSFIDITTGLPVVAAWLILAGLTGLTGLTGLAEGPRRRLPVIIAGLLMGLATGLKLSNAIFAIATVPAFLWLRGGARLKLGQSAIFCMACAAGFAVVAGPWGWRLYEVFGNPFFPMFNGLFRSPDFVLDGAALDRFLPRSLADALSLPFRMVLPHTMIHVETASPDLRYAALVAFVAAVLAWLGYRAARPTGGAVPGSQPEWRLVGAIGTIFLLSWGMWLLTSGNSRYFIPAASLVGVLLVGLGCRVFQGRALAWSAVACACLVLVQGVQVIISAAPRFSAAGWSDRWIETSVPARYRDQPYFFITVQPQSLSFLAPAFHPASGFFNAAGGYAFDPDGPGGARARGLLDRFDGRLRTLIGLDVTDEAGRFRVPDLGGMDQILIPWGLVVDRDDCDAIGVAAGLPLLKVTLTGVAGRTVPGPILSCGLRPAPPGARQAQDAARREISPVFERLEAACPDLFKPRGLRIEGGADRWYKSYTATDTRLTVTHGRVSYFSAVRGGDPVGAGSVANWLDPEPAAWPVIDCSRRASAVFGGLGH